MTSRRRRSESLWDRKGDAVPQNASPKQEAANNYNNNINDESLMSGGQPSREQPVVMQENENMSNDNDRFRMKMDPAFDEWETQYSSRPSDSISYGQQFRSGGGNGNKDRDRSRGRDRDRGSMRGPARSRSRSRSRGRGRSPPPLSDERRESYESSAADLRNDSSQVSSRPCKDFAAGNCTRGTHCRFLHHHHQQLLVVDSRGGLNRLDNEYNSGGSRFRDSDDRPPSKGGSDGYRKDTAARNEDFKHRSNRSGYDDHDHDIVDQDQDHRRQTIKPACRFFSAGKCNRPNCKFSHDLTNSGGYEGRSHDNTEQQQQPPQDHGVNASGFSSDFPKNDLETWNNLESGGFDDKNHRTWGWNESEKNSSIFSQTPTYNMDMDLAAAASNLQESQLIRDSSQIAGHNNQQIHSYGGGGGEEEEEEEEGASASQFPSTLNGPPQLQLNGSGQGMVMHQDLGIQNKPPETCKNGIPQVMNASTDQEVLQVSQNLNLANALGLLYSLPNSSSGVNSMAVVEQNQMVVVNKSNKASVQQEENNNNNQISVEPVSNTEVKMAENTNVRVKVEEGIDEKAMRQFKMSLVEFVKEILKPTWKEGKMSREVYKTIVKKVVDKVTTTIQGVQIPRTQDKIDQYLAFSKSKITKLVEAYVGRFLKA